MSVKTYSKKKHGNTQLTKNFKLKEFACPGTDIIKYDNRLAPVLQKVRDHFGGPVNITSGYRNPAHNRKVGGSSNSRHLEGRAADVRVYNGKGKIVPSKEVMCYAQDIGLIGIGYISPTACHLDFKTGAKYRYDETKRRGGYFVSFKDCYSYFGIKKKSSSSKPSSGKTMYVKAKSGLNVRNKASITGKKVGVLKNGTKVTVIETKGNWCRIGTGKWVHKKYLSIQK